MNDPGAIPLVDVSNVRFNGSGFRAALGLDEGRPSPHIDTLTLTPIHSRIHIHIQSRR